MSRGKLVRDLIPDIIRAHGGNPVVERIQGTQLYEALLAKLAEEADELRAATDRDDAIAELADVLEVIRAITAHLDVSAADLEDAVDEKRKRRGGFTQGLFLVDDAASADGQ